jgi:hypothetical protein
MPDTLPKSVRYTNRWFCYLDLLGFANLIGRSDIDRVLPLYESALDSLHSIAAPKKSLGISFSWFSDTFIIFSHGGRDKDFSNVEQAGRLFFQKLVLGGIPVRGAISFGKLYTHLAKNIFIGQALIDAYRYGEGQDWLGFLLAPSALKRMAEVGLPPQHRAHYRLVPKDGILKPNLDGPVYAFAFNNGETQGRNSYVAALEGMKHKADPEFQGKYERTIAYLQSHWTPMSGSHHEHV